MRGARRARATEDEVAPSTRSSIQRRDQRRDSLLLPPISAASTSEANQDSIVGQSRDRRSGRGPQAQIVEGNNTVHEVAAQNSAPDGSDVRVVNVQPPGHKRSRSNAGVGQPRRRHKIDQPQQHDQFYEAEKELHPHGALGGWSEIRPFLPRQECILAPGSLCRLKKERFTVFSIKGCIGTLHDVGRYFLSGIAAELKSVNEMFGRTGGQSWAPAVVCIAPDGKCATHVMRHTSAFQMLRDDFGLSEENMAVDSEVGHVDGLVVVLLSIGLPHAEIEFVAAYCKANRIWHVADLLHNLDAFCLACFPPGNATNVLMARLQSHPCSDRSWLWRVGTGVLLHAPRFPISNLTCTCFPVRSATCDAKFFLEQLHW
jgi:hypothetical protein